MEAERFAMSINLTQIAKGLRKSATEAEQRLWNYLKAKQLEGLKFRRQEQIGRFIVDFVCYETGIVVEVDGGQHSNEKLKDKERTDWLNSQGFIVLRFWNNEVLTNIEGVLEAILVQCVRQHNRPPLPNHSRKGRGSNCL